MSTESVAAVLPEAPIVHLDSFLGEPNPDSPKLLFSIRIPAKHQTGQLSIVRMQDSDLAKLLHGAKLDYRSKSKFTVPTTAGPCIVKLHFLLFPNVKNEIQIDYTYTIPHQTVGELQTSNFLVAQQLDAEVGSRIHDSSVLRHNVSDFASIIHDLVCGFADQIYYGSLNSGTEVDYLVMTPPRP